MSMVADTSEQSEATGVLSLYFQLKEGSKADLEVVSEAAIHWVATIRAAAREIDPDAIIRVDLVDASEGSLRLNTILEWAESQLTQIQRGSGRYPRLRSLAIGLAVFAVIDAGPTYDFYFGDHATHLADEDRELITDMLDAIRDKPAVRAERQRFYKALERDPSISGIGVSEDKNAIPHNIIPSSQFGERSGLWTVTAEEKERTLWPVLDVTLIGPVLVKKPRSWRFRPEGLPEFSAMMRDERFLAALEEDHVRERLRIGIPMTIRLKVEETNIGGVWASKRGGRSVVEVISPSVT